MEEEGLPQETAAAICCFVQLLSGEDIWDRVSI